MNRPDASQPGPASDFLGMLVLVLRPILGLAWARWLALRRPERPRSGHVRQSRA